MKLCFPSLFPAIALATAGLMATVPAHAVGRLMDVNVIDRDSGTQLPVYRHDGQWWVAGRPGARYAIQIRNATRARLLGVMSVDGVNIITGETASWDQSGYALSSGNSTRILGWRKSHDEVASFNFTALPNSYAARTGRPDNVGVIGVAVYRERPPVSLSESKPLPPAPISGTAAPVPRTRIPAVGAAPPSQTSATADTATARAAGQAQGRAATQASTEPKDAEHLGTGHGARERSQVTDTTFARLSSQPDEVITIRYDSCENLVTLGVTTVGACPRPKPRPFPESDSNRRFTPDPPPDQPPVPIPTCARSNQPCALPSPSPDCGRYGDGCDRTDSGHS